VTLARDQDGKEFDLMSTSTGPSRVLAQPGGIDRRIAALPPRLRWAAGVLRLSITEPADGIDRALVRVRNSLGRDTQDTCRHTTQPDWHEHVHELFGLPWPCGATPEFEQLWPEIVDDVRTQGLSLGRGTYGGWDDGDPGLARAIWCLIRHLEPAKVVETGVARGVTSRIILEALERAGAGHLWSIDLPAMDPTLHREIGVAVPERLYGRWTYTTGTSRRRLPKLLNEIGPVDLFVHDSSHTERNILFELQQAWPAIRRGAVVADDVHQSRGFARFAATLPPGTTFVVDADDATAQFGVALKLG
jgi:Methyltransferase domain